MNRRRTLGVSAIIAALAAAGIAFWQDDGPHYLLEDPAPFAASFDAPPPRESAATRAELAELLALQVTRTDADVEAARFDRKTEIDRFYGALGFPAPSRPSLPALARLAERVEDDVRIHVRAAKRRFRRWRPYEIEPRLEPCIQDVQGDLSYPSGHAAYAYAMAGLLTMMVPERARELRARADTFARQRMVCGVHFPSDLAAGQRAAELLLGKLATKPDFTSDLDAARTELRSALGLAPAAPRG